MYKFEKSKTALYIQLFEQIKDDIQNAKLKANDKLPSIRSLANSYNISKNSVQNAYNELLAQGYIYAIASKGYFVNEDLYQKENKKDNTQVNLKNMEKYKYNFSPASLIDDTFPSKIWASLHNKALKQNLKFGSYNNVQGLFSLRTQLKNYLSENRAVSCDESQIVVCSGFYDAMIIIAFLLKEHTKSIALEKNHFRIAKKVFSQLDYEIENLDISNQEINFNSLKNLKSKLLYLTPAHQYMSGTSTPISNRIKILEWAKKTNSYIIEDDYDSELSYYNKPIPSLQGINNNDRVIYFGTVSKSFSPALRVAYLIIPKSLIGNYKQYFDYPFSSVPIDTQKTLELFISEGYFEKHIRKIRTINKKKHDLMKKYLKEKLKDEIKFLREGSGLNIVIKPTIKIDLKLFEKKCEEKKIKIYIRQKDKKDCLVMGFGGFLEKQIQPAIDEFFDLWRECKL